MLKNSLTILFSLFTLISAQSERSVIAITDAMTEGLSDFEVKLFFNRLESELVNLGQYDVTSRQEMDKILKEQRFQQSGCTDQECAAEIGKMLNADLMLLPSVLYDVQSKIISVNLKLVDVETARITTAITKDEPVKNPRDINNLLQDYVVELYRQHTGEKGGVTAPSLAEQIKGTGKLIIETDPVGASVVIDNVSQGVSPSTMTLEEGMHRMILSYDGYERIKKAVTVSADSTITIKESLIPLSGSLTVVSKPGGCKVYVNDEYRGLSPLNLPYLDVGKYFVKMTLDGYQDYVKKILIEWNKETVIETVMEPKPASVAFYSVPAGATVFVDDKKVGITTNIGLVVEIPQGRHAIKMTQKGYTPEKTEIFLLPADTKEVEFSLAKLPEGVSDDPYMGWVTIKGWPDDSKISLGGGILSLPVRYYELKSGKYSFKAFREGFVTKKIPITITAQKLTEAQFLLNPLSRKTASRRAWLFPGLGHFYAKKVQRGLFWSALEMVSLYGVYALYDNYQAKETEYNKVRDEYLAAESHDEINLKKKIYDTAFTEKNTALYVLGGMGSVAAGVWIWNVFDVRYAIPRELPMPKDSKLKFGFNTSGELGVQLEF